MKTLKKKYRTAGKIVFTLFSGLLVFLDAQAQERTEFLSLKVAIERSMSNNSAAQLAGLDEAIAREKYKQTKAGFLPQLNFSYSALTTNNPLNAFGFQLQQRTVTAADFNPNVLNHPSATADFTTKVELLQPLINLDAVYMKKSAQVQVESFQYKTLRAKEYLAFETQKAYHQLQMSHQAVSILEEALSTTKEIYEFINNRLLQGLIQKSDLLNAEVQMLGMESNLNEAKSNRLNASDYLSLLMNKPVGVLYTTEELEQATAFENAERKVSDNRADFIALEKAMQATSLMEKSSKMKYIPRLNSFGSFQWNDKRIAGFHTNSYLAGIQLTWNVFDGNNVKRQATGLKLEQEKLGIQLYSMRQESQLQLDKGYRDLKDALFKIRQYNVAMSQSEEALRILQNRYKEGLASTADVLAAQTQLAQQKLTLIQATLNYNISQAYINYLTATNNQN